VSVALIQIRATAGQRRPLGQPARDQGEDFAVWIRELADACLNLTGSLGHKRRRERRRRAVAQLEYLWKVASPRQLEWACGQLDKIDYDYSDLRRLRDQAHAKLREDGHLPGDERANGGANNRVG
jgi:hypothetical protein